MLLNFLLTIKNVYFELIRLLYAAKNYAPAYQMIDILIENKAGLESDSPQTWLRELFLRMLN